MVVRGSTCKEKVVNLKWKKTLVYDQKTPPETFSMSPLLKTAGEGRGGVWRGGEGKNFGLFRVFKLSFLYCDVASFSIHCFVRSPRTLSLLEKPYLLNWVSPEWSASHGLTLTMLCLRKFKLFSVLSSCHKKVSDIIYKKFWGRWVKNFPWIIVAGVSGHVLILLCCAYGKDVWHGISSHQGLGNKRKGNGQSLIDLLLGTLPANHRPPSRLFHHPEAQPQATIGWGETSISKWQHLLSLNFE